MRMDFKLIKWSTVNLVQFSRKVLILAAINEDMRNGFDFLEDTLACEDDTEFRLIKSSKVN